MKHTLNMPETIAIIGLGQMGGSLAKAAKKHNAATRIIAYHRRMEPIQAALAEGTIDFGSTDPEEILSQADLTILALPIPATIEFARQNNKYCKPGSIVTDLSSVKGVIADQVRPEFVRSDIHFIGSHPMAGSEATGFQSASEDIYENAIVFTCPFCTDDPAAANIIRQFWRDLNCRVYEVDANEHDEAVAHSSHMLHLLSTASVLSVYQSGNPQLNELAGAGGFRDMSRIAASSPSMWREITQYNSEAIIKALEDMQKELKVAIENVKSGDWNQLEEYFKKGKIYRDQWAEMKEQTT